MVQCEKFSQYEKSNIALRNFGDNLLFFKEKIYIFYKT